MSEDLIVQGESLVWAGRSFRCALGKSGLSTSKKEGDGCTPEGVFPLRQVFYRPDKIARPITKLPVSALSQDDGWCDEPDDPLYNQLVKLPYAASHEDLWRDDDLYDLIVVIGYNDRPVSPGLGSAIFMHVARATYEATAGCVALALFDLQILVANVSASTKIVIEPVKHSQF